MICLISPNACQSLQPLYIQVTLTRSTQSRLTSVQVGLVDHRVVQLLANLREQESELMSGALVGDVIRLLTLAPGILNTDAWWRALHDLLRVILRLADQTVSVLVGVNRVGEGAELDERCVGRIPLNDMHAHACLGDGKEAEEGEEGSKNLHLSGWEV